MSEMGEVLRLLESFRADMREDFREVKADLRVVKDETKKTNGRVTDARERLTRIETEGGGDRERQKRWRDWVPQAVTAISSTALSVLLYSIFLAH